MNLKSLIQSECADYFRDGHPPTVHDWCETKDKPCVILAERKRCAYFEGAVLPAWMEWGGEYARHVQEEQQAAPPKLPPKSPRKTEGTRIAVCKVCGEAFTATGNRQQYCSVTCRQAGGRTKTKERVKRFRTPTEAAA